tara:strand:+ start:345 stop:542 length:198 start_codon:yes stop_codon:yes gene_type:complete
MSETIRETINICPTWEGITPVLLTAIANRGHVSIGDELVQEVLNMARAADRWNEHCKSLEDTPSD